MTTPEERAAAAMGVTLGQYRNRDNPYQEHCPVCGEPMIGRFAGRRDRWACCDTCQVRAFTGTGHVPGDIDPGDFPAHYRELTDADMFGRDGYGPALRVIDADRKDDTMQHDRRQAYEDARAAADAHLNMALDAIADAARKGAPKPTHFHDEQVRLNDRVLKARAAMEEATR